MAFDAFPSIAVPSAYDKQMSDPYIESTFETGDDAARAQFSMPRWQPFDLQWDWLSTADYATLLTFYDAHRATKWLWTEPRTGDQYVARFSSNAIKKGASKDKPGGYAVSATIQIVRAYTEA